MKKSLTLSLVVTSFLLFPLSHVHAGSVLNITDTMSNQSVGAHSSHVLKFTVQSALTNSGDKIIVHFPSDFIFSGSLLSDITFSHGGTTGTATTETIASVPSASAWGAVFSGYKKRTLTLTAPIDGMGVSSISANNNVTITYASLHAVNPTLPGFYKIKINTTYDSGSKKVQIF